MGSVKLEGWYVKAGNFGVLRRHFNVNLSIKHYFWLPKHHFPEAVRTIAREGPKKKQSPENQSPFASAIGRGLGLCIHAEGVQGMESYIFFPND